jgi:hypothetical protein
MIKTLIDFANGKIEKVDQTNKKIYLSDGSSWHKTNFHRNLQLVKAMILREVSDDPEIKELNKKIAETKAKALATRDTALKHLSQQLEIAIAQQDELNGIVAQMGRENMAKAMLIESPRLRYGQLTKALPRGKYKGQRVCDVAMKDAQYLDWFFKETDFEMDDFDESKPKVIAPAIQTPTKINASNEVGSKSPSNSLRYIILEHEDTQKLRFYFAKQYTSHSGLEEEFQNKNGREWQAVSGGFYAGVFANANTNLNRYWANEYQQKEDFEFEHLLLFGKSDSYGLNRDVFEKALNELRADMLKHKIHVMFKF